MITEPDLSDFDFHLPENLIALRPCDPRDACRLLVVQGEEILDRTFSDLTNFLKPGDLLIGNDTKVLPALLFGQRLARDQNGMDIDVQVNLLERLEVAEWRCLCKPGRRLKVGDQIDFKGVLTASVIGKDEQGAVMLRFAGSEDDFWAGIERIGAMPIPPYIAKKRPSDVKDHDDYQTVFANAAGSVAAPTAGLHFTPDTFQKLERAGVEFATVTLHVGAGTFAGLTQENLDSGKLHFETFAVSADVLLKIRQAKTAGRRIIAIGTTALRTLESIADEVHQPLGLSGATNIFIRPGYRFKLVDGLITNFHLPQSSLFMLVSALMGTDVMQSAYAHAIAEGYQFYSYGDASLLIPNHDRLSV